MKKTRIKLFAVLMALVMAFGVLPVAAFAEDVPTAPDAATYVMYVNAVTTPQALSSAEYFLSSRELVTRTFPANVPQNLDTGAWWRAVQLAIINEPVPGDNFTAPVFGNLSAINSNNAANMGGTILTMIATGHDPLNHMGRDLAQELVTFLNANPSVITTGSTWLMPQIFYALNAANVLDDVGDPIIDILLGLQQPSGGFDISGFASMLGWEMVEETAQMIVILEPFSHRDPRIAPALASARAYILDYQLPDGGFPMSGMPNLGIETTSRVVEAIAALGECPLEWTVGGDITLTPIHALINAMSPQGAFQGAQTEQAFVALAAVGLHTNPFTNLRNPMPFPDLLIPLNPNYPTSPLPPNGGDTEGGNDGDGTTPPLPPPARTATIAVRDPGGLGILFTGSFTLNANETAYSLLRRTGLAVNSRGTAFGAYVYGISGLREFDYGPLSGWMFAVNGVFPGGAADNAVINDGDAVEWLFTRDLGSDVGGGAGGMPPILPPADTVSDDASDDDGEDASDIAVVAEVDTELIDAIIADAIAEGMDYVILMLDGTEGATSIEVSLATESIAVMVYHGMVLTIVSDIAVVTIDTDTLAGLVHDANYDSEIVLIVNKNAVLNQVQREIIGENTAISMALLLDGEHVHGFNGVVTISVPFTPSADFYGFDVFHVDYYGNISEVEGAIFNDGYIIFSTSHFSVFFINERVEAAVGETAHIYEPSVDAFEILPVETLTRGRAVELLWAFIGMPMVGSDGGFTDIPPQYSAPIGWAGENGIVRGFGDGTFRPDSYITREHFAIVLRSFGEFYEIEINPTVFALFVGEGEVSLADAMLILQLI